MINIEMTDDLKIFVKLTLKDRRQYSFAKLNSGKLNKLALVINIFITLVLSFTVIFCRITFTDDDKGIFMILVLFTLPGLLILWGRHILTGLLVILSNNDKHKNKLLEETQCIRLTETHFEMYSSSAKTNLLWQEIYKIQEYKPCFVIFLTPGKYVILPRRCFINQDQLNLFREKVQTGMDKKKIKLKGYKLYKSNPDVDDIKITVQEHYEDNQNIEDVEKEVPLFKISFTYSKNELLSLRFKLYYLNPAVIILNLVGLLFFYVFAKEFIEFGFDSRWIVPFTMGFMIVIYIPFKFILINSKNYEKDTTIKKLFTFEFFEDYYYINNPNGESKTFWKDLVKVKENSSAFIFNVTKRSAHVIPKRVFDGMDNNLLQLRELIKCKTMSNNNQLR